MGIKATFSYDQIGASIPVSAEVTESAVVYVDEQGDLKLFPLKDLYERIDGAEGTLEDINRVYLNTLTASQVNLDAVDLVRQYANRQVDLPVEDGLYSAKHWATKAEDTYFNTIVNLQGYIDSCQGILDNVQAKSDYIDTVYLNTVNDANDYLSQTLNAYRDTDAILTTVLGIESNVVTKHNAVTLQANTVTNLHDVVVAAESNVSQLKSDTELLKKESESARDAAQSAQSATATMRDEVTTLKDSAESAASAASGTLASVTTLSDQVSQDASQVNTDKLAAQTAASNAQTSATQANNAKIASESVLSDVTGLKADVEDIAATLSSGIKMRGEWDASSGNAPSTPAGDVSEFYKITVAGTIDGVVYDVNDNIVYDPTNLTWFKVDNTESVTSVNGKKGVVTLTKNDVGLNAVDNTADLDKPVSAATQTALDLKIDKSGGTVTGDVTLDNEADLVFSDKRGVYPTKAGRFVWDLNNDKASIYANQPASDNIDFVFELTDNLDTTDRFMYLIKNWRGADQYKYPLIMDGTQTLVDVLSNADGTPDYASARLKISANRNSVPTIDGMRIFNEGFLPSWNNVTGKPDTATRWPTLTEIGLNNVDNTSDLDKPVSTATQAALDTQTHTYQDVDFVNNFDVNGSTGNAFDDGIYVGVFNEVVGSVNNPTYTAVISAQDGNHRSIHLTVDGSGYLWGMRSHSTAKTEGGYTFKSKVKEADDALALGGYTQDIFFKKNVVNNGHYKTTGGLFAGETSGSIAMIPNDGWGNANITFNHAFGNPDQDGNAARITFNTDSVGGASMKFQLKSSVLGGQNTNLNNVLELADTFVKTYTNFSVLGSISLTGLVDGRDVALDGAKLDVLDATSDIDKPISTATQAALNDKLPTSYVPSWDSVTGKPVTATRWPTKAEIGLGRVQNVRLNWAWGTGPITHIWGSQGSSAESYVYMPNDLRDAMDIRWSDVTSKPDTATRWPTLSEIGAASLSHNHGEYVVKSGNATLNSLTTNQGSTFNGKVTIKDDGTDSLLIMPQTENEYVGITFGTNAGITQWLLYTTNNANRDLALQGRADDGSYQHTTFSISRDTGDMDVLRNLKVKGHNVVDTSTSTQLLKGNVQIEKDNPWLTLKSSTSGDTGGPQGAGISVGESGYKGSAALHMTYTGDGKGYLGMGVVSNSIPNYWAMRFNYTDSEVYFRSNPSIAGNTNWHSGNLGSANLTWTGNHEFTSGFTLKRDNGPNAVFRETATDTYARFIVAGGISYLQAGANGSGAVSSSGELRFTGYLGNQLTSIKANIDGGYRDLWHTGNLVKTTSATDTTEGRVPTYRLVGGIFGLGSTTYTDNDLSENNTLNTYTRFFLSQGSTATGWDAGTLDSYPMGFNFFRSAIVKSQMAMGWTPSGSGTLAFRTSDGSGNFTKGWNKVWHSGNDGSGSGLDADLLDGLHASNFVRNDIAQSVSQKLTMNNGAQINGDILITGNGATIAGSNFNNGWLKIGNSAAGIAFDSNGQYFAGEGIIGTFAGNLALRPAGNIDISNKKLQIGGGGLIYNDGAGRTRIDTPNGYLSVGPANSGYCHFYTDRPRYYFDREVQITNLIRVYNTNTYLKGTGSRVGVGAVDIGTGSGQDNVTGLEVYQPSSTIDSMMSFHIAGNYAVHFGLDADRRRLVTGGWSDGNNLKDVLTRQFLYYTNLSTSRYFDYKTTGNAGRIGLYRPTNGARLEIAGSSYQKGDTIEIFVCDAAGTLEIVNTSGAIYYPDGTSVAANVPVTVSVDCQFTLTCYDGYQFILSIG